MKWLHGPYHENIRQLVDSSYYYDRIKEKIRKINTKAKEIEITVNPQITESVIGYKRENIEKIKNTYNLEVKIKQNLKVKGKKMDVKVTKTYKEFADDDENMVRRK